MTPRYYFLRVFKRAAGRGVYGAKVYSVSLAEACAILTNLFPPETLCRATGCGRYAIGDGLAELEAAR